MEPKGQQTTTYHVFLASPGDMDTERKAVRSFFDTYNREVASKSSLRFQIIDWENYSTIGIGRPQELITEQTLEENKESLALVIGIMGQRFGSPTGKAESGTEEEIIWAYESHKKYGFPEIKLFFREFDKILVSPNYEKALEDLEQWKKVITFQSRLQQEDPPVWFARFSDENPFADVLSKDLKNWLGSEQRSWSKQDQINIKKPTGPCLEINMPPTGAYWVNRIHEVECLHEIWPDPKQGVVTIAGRGGMGKSALVSHWLKEIDIKPGTCEGVFAHTFSSRTDDKQERSSLKIIESALECFGEDDPDSGTSWAKGTRLANVLNRKRVLLILDGLERFQHVPSMPDGQIQDEALCGLLETLMDDPESKGLCVITTRTVVRNLTEGDFNHPDKHYPLSFKNLKIPDGVKLLKDLGVRGSEDDLKDAVVEWNGHPLCLRWLGAFLVDHCGGEIGRRRDMGLVGIEKEDKENVQKLINFYVRYFNNQPEICVLRLTGLFDHPIQRDVLNMFRKTDPIPNLTDLITPLSERDFADVVERLRNASLLTKAEDPDNPYKKLEAHPLVRQHFAQELEDCFKDFRQTAHRRVYQKLINDAHGPFTTFEELRPLFRAVVHACRAEDYQYAWDEIFWRQIRRNYDHYPGHNLGEWSYDLEVLSNFFEKKYTVPAITLEPYTKAKILNEAGFDMRALGRLKQAQIPLKKSWEEAKGGEYWDVAVIAAGNMSKIKRALGELSNAKDWASKSIRNADQNYDQANEGDEGYEWSKVWRMSARTWKAEILHQLGNYSESEKLFKEAEEIQQMELEFKPDEGYLWGTAGFRYCDLLLDRGEHFASKWAEKASDADLTCFSDKESCARIDIALRRFKEVKKRAEITLNYVKQKERIEDKEVWLNSVFIALDKLTIGRASFLEAKYSGSNDFSDAETYLKEAVEMLIELGDQTYIVRGHLERAAMYREKDNEQAEADILEASKIADQCSMRLHKADCHLEFARLLKVRNDDLGSADKLLKASKMVEDMKYHRRDREILELQKQLPIHQKHTPKDEIASQEKG